MALGLENNIPFSRAAKIHPQNLSGRQGLVLRRGAAAALPVPAGLAAPRVRVWGHSLLPTAVPVPAARWPPASLAPCAGAETRALPPCPAPPSCAPCLVAQPCRRAESAPSPATDPPLCPLPPVSVALRCERAAAVLGHGRLLPTWGTKRPPLVLQMSVPTLLHKPRPQQTCAHLSQVCAPHGLLI